MHPMYGADCTPTAGETKRLVQLRCGSVVAFVLGAVLLTSIGCKTVGEDYSGVTNPPLLPEYFQITNLPTTDGCPPCGLPETASWNNIDDGMLGELIARGLQNNPSVHELIWRITEAENAVRIVSGQKRPFVDAVGIYQGRKSSSTGQTFNQTINNPFEFMSVGLNSRWEIDIVGRIRRETESATGTYEATKENVADLRRILAGNIARAYVLLRMNQELLYQTQATYAIQQSTIKDIEARMEAGQVTRLDLVQIRSRMELTRSLVPVYDQEIQKSFHAIALLIGTTPSQCEAELLAPRLQLNPKILCPEVPADLLRRRPDIRRSEREVAAACALVGVAQAEFYPRLNIVGTIGYNSRKLSNLLDYDSLAWGVGPGVTWNILSLGRIEAQVEIQKAQLEQAIARYQQSVLTAVSEVENALVTQIRQRERISILLQSTQDAQESVELAMEQYRVDKVSVERVDSNQRRLLQCVTDLALARAEAATSSIDLLQALGGSDLDIELPKDSVDSCPPQQAKTGDKVQR